MAALHSMTGYAVETAELPAGNLSLELRAVNSRFLDLVFRMGEEFRQMEPLLRERIGGKVKRGKLECRINFTLREAATLPETPDTELLARLSRLSEAIRASVPETRPMSVYEILRWPGMLGEGGLDPEALNAAVMALLDKALAGLTASRAREGVKLKDILLDRVAAMRRQTAQIAPKVPEIVGAYREKLTRRMEELLPTADPDRLLQEVALFAQKIDVDEELGRLNAHLGQVERVLQAGGAAGKRLDFLMQELNREANTLGSKSATVEFTQASVELKVLIEQMREQVQNIE